ncbi:hypothetical protein [Nonomuraea africana]|uniref:hypothetical protein n=1 Tax=Nonomuraea africana TaxID=46171 RepID=UPI0033F3232A
MAFLSRLFKRGSGDPLAERDRERDDAHRQGLKDARELPLPHFTDPDCEPAFLSEVRARARERIARVDQGLAARRTDLLREVSEARETVFRETGRADLYPEARPGAARGSPEAAPNGRPAPAPFPAAGARPDVPLPAGTAGAHPSASLPDAGTTGAHPSTSLPDAGTAGGGGGEGDPFISIAEARWRRAERAREAALREASDRVHRARARIEQLAREWDGVLVERNHEVEAVHAWAQQVIAAYRRGVMAAHPRREEIPSLWKGEVVAMDSVGDGITSAAAREELGGLLEEVEHRIEIWHSEVREARGITQARGRRELGPGSSEEDEDPGDPARTDADAGAVPWGEANESGGRETAMRRGDPARAAEPSTTSETATTGQMAGAGETHTTGQTTRGSETATTGETAGER